MGMFAAHPIDARRHPNARPVSTGARAFGAPRDGGRVHDGVDLPAPASTPVRAVVGGRVVRVRTRDVDACGFGLTIAQGSLRVLYCHLNAPPVVDVGDTVEPGQVVGVVGASGDATGPHLHLEASVDGVSLDPTADLLETYAADRGERPEVLVEEPRPTPPAAAVVRPPRGGMGWGVALAMGAVVALRRRRPR